MSTPTSDDKLLAAALINRGYGSWKGFDHVEAAQLIRNHVDAEIALALSKQARTPVKNEAKAVWDASPQTYADVIAYSKATPQIALDAIKDGDAASL